MKGKKINVHLQYPWMSADSSYYKNIINYAPKSIKYTNFKKEDKKIEGIGSNKKFEQTRRIKNLMRKILRIIKIPNLTYTKNKCDIIHCAHCLSLNKKPWIVDTETYDRISAAGGNVADKGLGKRIIKNRLESPNCKKIIAWSEDCRKTFEKAFPKNKKILDKLTILPFAIPKFTYKKIPHKKIRILFVARWFDAKGGRQTLEVFDRLTKRHDNLECWFICPIPEDFRRKYGGNKQIKIMELMPQDKLFKDIYPAGDIFFYPGFGDSYGFAVPEALMFGLPIISTKTFAKSELIEDKRTGFLVNMPNGWKGYQDMNENWIREFVEKTSVLIEDKKLREKMSQEAIRQAERNFSIEARNKKLKEIYYEALRE